MKKVLAVAGFLFSGAAAQLSQARVGDYDRSQYAARGVGLSEANDNWPHKKYEKFRPFAKERKRYSLKQGIDQFALRKYSRYRMLTNFRRCRFQRDFFKTIWCYPVTQVRRWGATDKDVTWKAALLLAGAAAATTALLILILWLCCCKCRHRLGVCCCLHKLFCCCRKDEYGYDNTCLKCGPGMCCCQDIDGIPTLKFDPRSDDVANMHDDHLRAMRTNHEKSSTNLMEVGLSKKLRMNKMTSEHEMNRLKRVQNEITRKMSGMHNYNNASMNKLSNNYQTVELKKHQNDILSEMQNLGVVHDNSFRGEKSKLRREQRMSNRKKDAQDIVHDIRKLENMSRGESSRFRDYSSDTSHGSGDIISGEPGNSLALAAELRHIENEHDRSHRRSSRRLRPGAYDYELSSRQYDY